MEAVVGASITSNFVRERTQVVVKMPDVDVKIVLLGDSKAIMVRPLQKIAETISETISETIFEIISETEWIGEL